MGFTLSISNSESSDVVHSKAKFSFWRFARPGFTLVGSWVFRSASSSKKKSSAVSGNFLLALRATSVYAYAFMGFSRSKQLKNKKSAARGSFLLALRATRVCTYGFCTQH